MARRRGSTVQIDSQGEVVGERDSTNNEGEDRMSVFETMDRESWVEAGAGQSAQKGEYAGILTDFAETGQRYGRILTAADSGGRFAGKQASSVTTALKNARDAKSAPDAISKIKVSSKEGVVYLENEAIEV